MSEEQTGQTAEQAAEAKAAKKKTEYTEVQMEDGRKVLFAGKRKVNRDVTVHKDAEGNPTHVSVRFDYLNGKSHEVHSHELTHETILQLVGHGLSQKIGDESAGVQSVDDMVLGGESMIGRLKKGEFYTAREPGDSFSGASIVIRAVCEATGKPVDWVKAFLQKKLDSAKEKGEKLSRKELYDSFRNPASKTGPIIERMEKEERAKAGGKVNAASMLDEAMEAE